MAWWHACHRRWEQLSSLSHYRNRKIEEFWRVFDRSKQTDLLDNITQNRRRCPRRKSVAETSPASPAEWAAPWGHPRHAASPRISMFCGPQMRHPSGPSNWTCHNSVSGWRCPCPQHAVHLLNLCVHLVKTVNGYIDMSYDDIWWHGDDSMILCDSMISNISILSTIATVPAARQEDFACSALGAGCASNFRLAWRGQDGLKRLQQTS